MLNRRELFKRAMGFLGLAVMTQKFPQGVLAMGSDAIVPSGHSPLFLIDKCVFSPGDPSLNDPEWIEDSDTGLVLRNQRLRIDGRLTLSQAMHVSIQNSIFDDVQLNVGALKSFTISDTLFSIERDGLAIRAIDGFQGLSLTNSRFRRAPGTTGPFFEGAIGHISGIPPTSPYVVVH